MLRTYKQGAIVNSEGKVVKTTKKSLFTCVCLEGKKKDMKQGNK